MRSTDSFKNQSVNAVMTSRQHDQHPSMVIEICLPYDFFDATLLRTCGCSEHSVRESCEAAQNDDESDVGECLTPPEEFSDDEQVREAQ